ncbi:hypothetical protein TNCV_4727331 [Trichonephila clavipes]|nr:hypothetical protein TNCV_4727331 [Trichonephila clavipes]
MLILEDISLEIGVRVEILVEGTEEIGARVKISVEGIEDKGDKDDQVEQLQSVENIPISLSAICLSSEALPYVPILLNETFTKALWDTVVKKSFISEDIYKKYF